MTQSTNAAPVPRPRLLFVDSSRLMRNAANRILGNEFRVLLAEDSKAAWVMLLDDPLIQVVFYDLQTNEQSKPPTLLDRIRSSESRRVRDTPVVIITDNDDSEESRKGILQRGGTDFIDKPFRPSELLARARAHATTADAVQRLRLMQRRHNKCSETELGNRRYFFERMAQALSFAIRKHQPLSLVHVHLDGLAAALELLDPGMRKKLLARLGRILARAVRREDTVYRTGPETFSFILPGTNEAGAETVRCRLVPELDDLGLLDSRNRLNVTSRFIVQVPDYVEGETLVDCLRRIREGMGAMLISQVEPSAVKPRDTGDNLDELLEMARLGDTEHLREQLPELLARLRPLLQLADRMEASDKRRGDAKTPD